MIDLDKILREKLDEEADFPRMEQNWSKLAERLPKAQPTKVRPLYWGWYAVAACALLLLSTGTLAWNIWKTQSENALLQQHIAQLKQKNDTPVNKDVTMTIQKTDTVYVYLNEKTNERIGIAKTDEARASILKNQTTILNPPIQSKKVARNNKSDKDNIGKNSIAQKNALQKPSEDKAVNKAESSLENKNQLAAQDQSKATQNIPNAPNNISPDETIHKDVSAKTPENERMVSENTSIEIGEQNKTVLPQLPKIALKNIVFHPSKTQTDNDRDDLREAIAHAQYRFSPILVKKVGTFGRLMPEIAVGGLAFTTFPTNTVSSFKGILGAGASLEIGLTDNIRLYSTAEWGGADYNIMVKDGNSERSPRENLPPPPPSRDEQELRSIAGRRNLSQFAVNAKYRVPSVSWLTPTFQVGHTWRNQAAQPVAYEFRDRRNGQIETVYKNGDAQTFADLWQVGIGVEKSFGHFNVAVNLDYQKDFAQKTYDYWLMRAGVSYRF